MYGVIMNILGWVVWAVAMSMFIAHIFLFFYSDPGVTRLAKRFSFLIAIGLAITAFTKLSKFHLIWWVPVAYLLNLWAFSVGVQRGAKKFLKSSRKKKRSK